MKNKTNILTILTYVMIFSAGSVLLNDLRTFDFEQFKSFESWARTADNDESWFATQNAIQWSYYAISAALFFWRGYLIFGFTYFFSILKEVEQGNYFGDKVIRYFKKIGDIFIYYVISVFVLRSLLALIQGTSFRFLNEFKEEFTFLIPCGIGFYILSEIFKRAKQLKEENELTI